MATEQQLLNAFQIWRDTARTLHTLEKLPIDEELIAAAEDPERLKDTGDYPALQVWAKALRRVAAYANVGALDAVRDTSDVILYEPDFDVVFPDAPTAGTPEPDLPEPVDAEVLEDEPFTFIPEPEVPAVRVKDSEVTAAPRESTGRSRKSGTDPDLRSWSDFEFSRLDAFANPEALPGSLVRVTAGEAGGLELHWEFPDTGDARITLFRVVSDEQVFEKDPDYGEHRAVTVATRWVDRDELTTAYRMYQVWMYQGDSEADAVRSQPSFIGDAVYIRPVGAIDLSVTGSEVKGQWEPAEHTHRVAVFAARMTERLTTNLRNEIATATDNLNGFRYTPPNRGHGYKFVAQRFVLIDGVERAAGYSGEFSVDVPAEVVAVPIRVEKDPDFEEFHVSWDAPYSGEVRIYRTQEAPDSELAMKEISTDRLEGFGLTRRDLIDDEGSAERSRTVEWPEDWYSVFITPVNVVGNQAKVGRTYSSVRVGDFQQLNLHERVSNQLLTFDWPKQAHEVTAVFGEQGTGDKIGPGAGEPGVSLASIHKDAYEQEGGMRFTPPGPGDIALFGSRVYEGRQIWGRRKVTGYPGLARLNYRFLVRDGGLFLGIFSGSDDTDFRQFSLRIHPSRLPLEVEDGQEVPTRAWKVESWRPEEAEFKPGISTSLLHRADTAPYQVWEVDPAVREFPPSSLLRLLARAPEGPDAPVVALTDPDPDQLRLKYWMGG